MNAVLPIPLTLRGEPSRFDAKPFGFLFESIEALHCCGTRRCATSGFRGSGPI